MRKIFTIGLLLIVPVMATYGEVNKGHDHSNRVHEKSIDGDKFDVDVTRFNKFIDGLFDVKVVVVSVKGMVCDFCARGIKKTFKRNSEVRKVDVDLGRGKVLIAFSQGTTVDFKYISRKILENGQTATKLTVLEIR